MTSPTPRAILAANLRRIIEKATPPGERFSVRAWALGKDLDVRLITRLVNEEHAVTIDTLDKIAEACGLKPWHLLLEDFDPASAPADAPITAEDRALLTRLRKLLDK